MLGRSHILSGWCTGALTATAIGLPPVGIVAFGCVTAGASALNDLDHDDACASRVLGPVSRALAELVQAYARLLYRLTRGPGDPRRRGAHRGATHSIPLLLPPCGVLAVLPQVLPAVWAAWLVGVVIGFCLLLVADRLGSRVLAGAVVTVVLGGGVSLDADPVAALVVVAPWVALAVLTGTVTHVLGDLVTESGLYAFAPLYHRGEGERRKHWVRIALPKWLAFKTSGWFELGIVFPALVVCGVLLVPGVWSVVITVLNDVVAVEAMP